MLTREEEIKPSITVVPREQRLPLPQSSIHPSIHPSIPAYISSGDSRSEPKKARPGCQSAVWISFNAMMVILFYGGQR